MAALLLAPSVGVVLAARLGIIVPLVIASLVVAAAIPTAARRGKLSIPAYGGIAIGAAVVGFSLGHFAGVRQVRGTPLGVSISILFFLLIATVLGCLLSLFFYREPPES